MERRTAIAIAVAAGAVAVAIPVVVSLELARQQATEEEFSQLRAVANDVTRRAADVVTQFTHAIEILRSSAPPCSEANIARMREIDVGSSALQAVGHVAGDRLMCSSLGGHGDGIALGPADGTGRRAIRIWHSIELPFAPGRRFIVLEKDGYAAIVHPDLPIDVFTTETDISVAVVALQPRKVLASRGVIKPEWFARSMEPGTVSFADGQYLVVVEVAPEARGAAIAATPIDAVDARVGRFAVVLAPLGLAVGLAMAVAIYFVTRQRISLQGEMQAALKRKEFFLVYQPLVDLGTRQIRGAEALIRWKRRDGSMLRPDIFIPVAEESDLIKSITEYVITMVAVDAAELIRRHPEFHIGINLSSADLQSHHTVELLRRLVQGIDGGPRNILVEATERGFLKAEVARQIVKAIRGAGIRVAIDDFGTGYSSLAYLETFELDYLKIDKSFVGTLGTEAASSHVALHIIEMAKSLGLEMIAEGVETEAQAKFLSERGVQFAQGWLFGKPMPIVELAALIDAQNCEPAQLETPEHSV